MQFALLIYEDEKRFLSLDQTTMGSELAQYQAFGTEFSNAIKGGKALEPTHKAQTVRVRDGKAISTDGPFAETKEQLGGFYLVEARDAAEAAAIGAKIPGARYGCVEVRPVMVFS